MSGCGWIRIWPCLVLALWLGACTDDTFEEENRSDVVDQTTADSSDELRVNTFMYNVMRTYYYWNDRLPELDTIPDKEPETFFEELVYEGDQFSWLTKEWNGATKSESSSDQYTFSYGFTYSLGAISNAPGNYFAFVEVVYPNTPAEREGLKRGDIILSVNGAGLTSKNYTLLSADASSSSVSLGLGLYNANQTITPLDTKISLNAENVYLDPVVHYSIIDRGNRRIGYLVYMSYEEYANETLDKVIAYFKKEGITDLVLDLRYNLGGDETAARHLCSLLAPVQVVSDSEVLITRKYSDSYMAIVEKSENKDASLNLRFDPSVSVNLNLDQLYVLTGLATASASELTIVGLEPYMDVRTFGETTYGKCYGGYNMTPDMYNPSWTDLTDWKLYLISFMFANADGLTDFTDGLRPDVEVPSVVETVPLGSEEDHLLGTALEAIGGSLRAGQVGLERGIPLEEHVVLQKAKGLVSSMPF